jgi:hypothetical protein
MAEKWTLKGEMAGICNCNSPCPCIFGQDPTHGKCGALQCHSITKGSFGKVDLSGRKVAIAFEWTGNVFSGGITFGLYVDDGATPDQVSAFEQIYTGKAGGAFEQLAGLFETIKGVKQSPIEFKNGGGATFQIGSLGSAEVQLLTGADQKGPLVVLNSPFDFGGKGLKVGRSTGRFVDRDWGFDFPMEYGDVGTIDLSS